MYQNENFHSSSITLMTSRNQRLTIISVKAFSKATVYENTNLLVARGLPRDTENNPDHCGILLEFMSAVSVSIFRLF